MGGAGGELRLAALLVALADTLGESFDEAAYLARFADGCVSVLGVDAAGVVLVRAGAGVTLVTSGGRDGRAARALVEHQHHGGPCLDVCTTGVAAGPVDLTGPAAARRWPRLSARARREGLPVTCAVPLRRGGTVLGALVLFARARPSDLRPDLAQLLADAAALGLAQRRMHADCRALTGQLQSALSSRVRIEQAKGLLAERWGVTADEAFTALRAHARRVRRPLDALAQALLDGHLDDAALDREQPEPPGDG